MTDEPHPGNIQPADVLPPLRRVGYLA